MDSSNQLLWNQLKIHIQPPEVEYYARRIGLARISRNEEAFQERETLLQMRNSIQDDIQDEISKKNTPLLDTLQRKRAISKAINFLDNLKEQGHFVEPDNQTDSEMINYLKITRSNRPNSQQTPKPQKSDFQLTQSQLNLDQSVTEVQALVDDEYNRIQTEINEIRVNLFSSADELKDVQQMVPPSTDSIEAFNKKLQTKDFIVRQMNKTANTSSSVSRLRDSIRANRLWE